MIERLHLKILRAIDEQGTLTLAAKELNLTQSALSHGIKKLENRLGTDLWRKDGRRLRFTPAGEQLLALANRVLPQLEHSEQVLREFAQGKRGNLRVGMECHPCYRWLLRTISPFLHDWTMVDVDVKQAFQFGGLGALLNHDIDMLITPDPVFKAGLVYTPVFDYELVLVVAQDHPFTELASIKPEMLSQETLITYPVEIDRLDIFNLFLQPAGCRPKVHKTIETTDILLEMVAAGRGITALPRWLVEEYIGTMPIEIIPLNGLGMTKKIHIGVRKEDADIDYIKGFIDIAHR